MKMWIAFLIPKIEDGNNFGVSVQVRISLWTQRNTIPFLTNMYIIIIIESVSSVGIERRKMYFDDIVKDK